MNTSFFQEDLGILRPAGAVVIAGLLAANAFAADVIAPLGKAPQSPPVVVAQPQQAFSPGVADVVKMLDAKVDPEVVKAYINSSPIAYSPGAEEIIALKQRGVPDDLITAMLERGAEVRGPPAGYAPAPSSQPQVTAPLNPPYASTASVIPDYAYDYGYPGYPSATYWDGYYGYPWYAGWGYPWYGNWWWYNYWYPCSFSFYVPFYCGWYGYHHHPYYCGYHGHNGDHYYGPYQHHNQPYGSGRGTWAQGQGSGRASGRSSPYGAVRDGYVRSAPSAASAPSARSVAPRSGTTFATRSDPGVSTSTRSGLYSNPGVYRGSSGAVRGTSSYSTAGAAQSSPLASRNYSSTFRSAPSARSSIYSSGSVGRGSVYSSGSIGRSSPYSSGSIGRSSPYSSGSIGRSSPYSSGGFRSSGSIGGVRGGGFSSPGVSRGGGGFGGGGSRGGSFGGGGGSHGGGGFSGGGGGGHR